VICGCLIGMTSLLFMDLEKAERAKRAAELDTIFSTVLASGHGLLKCEKVTLFMVDKEKQQVWSRIKTGEVDTLQEIQASFDELDSNKGGLVSLDTVTLALAKTSLVVDHRNVARIVKELKLGQAQEGAQLDHADFKMLIDNLMMSPELRFRVQPGGILDSVIRSKKPVNVKHAEEDAGFAAAFPDDKYTGRHIRSMLYTPVINEEGEVVAVMEALNRHFCGGAYVGPFTQEDVRLCQLLCTHVSQFMKQSGFN